MASSVHPINFLTQTILESLNLYRVMPRDTIEGNYRQLTPKSSELFERASKVIPGGDTRNVTHHRPYPSYISDANEDRLTTVDEEELIDFINNYTANIHGHAFPPIVDAVRDRLSNGNSPGAPIEEFIVLAEELVDRTESIELVRFCNSGTESTMHAIRGAMAYSGNSKVLKVKGGYHGSHDTVQIGVHGDGRENLGIPPDIERRVETVEYNNVERLKSIFEDHGDQLACFILEPVLGVGGMIPASDDFIQAARDITHETETILILDEVITYRLSKGGAQEIYNISPDLTTLGKMIGGGFPIGAFGGRSEIMNIFHPTEGSVSQSGTFSGNPAAMIGGIKSLDAYDSPAIERINRAGQDLRDDLNEIASDIRDDVTVTGKGSLFHIHFNETGVNDIDPTTVPDDENSSFFFKMREHGVYISPRGMCCLSTPMSQKSIDTFKKSFTTSLSEMEP